MDIKKMLERENKNYNKIYLYADMERDLYNAYEFSAYLLTRKFDMLELQGEFKPETGTVLYIIRLTPEFVMEQFFSSDTTVSDSYIKVILDEQKHCIQWKADFKEFKKQRQKVNDVPGAAGQMPD